MGILFENLGIPQKILGIPQRILEISGNFWESQKNSHWESGNLGAAGGRCAWANKTTLVLFESSTTGRNYDSSMLGEVKEDC